MDFGDEQQLDPWIPISNNPPPLLPDTSGRSPNEDRLASLTGFPGIGPDLDQDIDLSLDTNWETYVQEHGTGRASGLQNSLPQENNEPCQSTWNMDSVEALMNMPDDHPFDLGQQYTFEAAATIQPYLTDFQIQTLPFSNSFPNQLLTSSITTPQNSFMPSSSFDLETRLNPFFPANYQTLLHPPPIDSPRSNIYLSSQTNPQDQSLLLLSNDQPTHLFPLSFTNVEPQLPRSLNSELFGKESYQVGVLEDECSWPNPSSSLSTVKEFPSQLNLEASVLENRDDRISQSAGKAKNAPHNKAIGPTSKRKDVTSGFPGSKRVCATDYNESTRGFYTFSVNLDKNLSHGKLSSIKKRGQRKPRSAPVCIRCRVQHKRCEGSGISCSYCLATNRSCIRAPDLISLLTIPDVDIDIGQRAEKRYLSSTPSKTWTIKIFLDFALRHPSPVYEPSLKCKISLQKTTPSKFCPVSAVNSRTWKLLSSEGRKSHCQNEAGRCLLNCSIPINSMPPVEKLQQWALESMRANPSGAIGNSHGQLFIFATYYAQSGIRPLHDLVTLILILTSIYNVCHSKLMLVFEKRPNAPSHICPPLRAQLCAPLYEKFEEIGVAVQEELIKALDKGHGPAEDNSLALFIIIWMLVLIYDHSLNQTNNAIRWNTQNQSSLWRTQESAMQNKESIRPDEESALEELVIKRNRLRHLIRDIGKLYNIFFVRRRKRGSSIFKDDILEVCNISAEDTGMMTLLSKLRMALREPHIRARVPSAPPEKDLDRLLNSISMMSVQPISYEAALPPVPLPSVCTLSEKNRLDFDNMSSEKSSKNGE